LICFAARGAARKFSESCRPIFGNQFGLGKDGLGGFLLLVGRVAVSREWTKVDSVEGVDKVEEVDRVE
jgi:hypothetical protein